ncbi:hypothetical protein PoB_002709400 [Plakobranchus ocellatus]|uniref:Uncharacterized protein n=1 Tax=Plakobranchus ocellatus TaxID=259542 RepID=A0AAV3ZZ15_9GAST|nr:hypothetical protein PoB_002709400 [Plakobranchus ocellatus]
MDSIPSPSNRVDRTRRLLEIIFLGGPVAHHEFLLALESQGYDHVAYRLRNTDLKRPMSRFGSLSPPSISRTITQRAVHMSTAHHIRATSPPFALSLTDVTVAATTSVNATFSRRASTIGYEAEDLKESGSTIDNRIKRIEDAWFILKRSKEKVRRLQASVEQQEQRAQEEETRHAQQTQELTQRLQEHQAKVEERNSAIANLQAKDADKESRLQAQEARLQRYGWEILPHPAHSPDLDTLREQSLQLCENSRRLDQLSMLIHSHAQTGNINKNHKNNINRPQNYYAKDTKLRGDKKF